LHLSYDNKLRLALEKLSTTQPNVILSKFIQDMHKEYPLLIPHELTFPILYEDKIKFIWNLGYRYPPNLTILNDEITYKKLNILVYNINYLIQNQKLNIPDIFCAMLYISAYNFNFPESIDDNGYIIAWNYLQKLEKTHPTGIANNFLSGIFLYSINVPEYKSYLYNVVSQGIE